MKDLEKYPTTDTVDPIIRQGLKNWAAKQQPPAMGRARLLLDVSSPPSLLEQASDAWDHIDWPDGRAAKSGKSSNLRDNPWLWGLQFTLLSSHNLI